MVTLSLLINIILIMTHFRTIDLKQKDIDEYKRIYRMEYGEELTDEEARESAINFLRFMSFIL